MSRIRSIALPGRALLPVLALLSLWPAASALAQDADHLLLGEVVVMTRADRIEMFGSPFIEVVNPTDAIVDLSDVYLSTGHDSSLNQLYWNVVTGENLGGGTSGNVHCKFPAGMTLAGGQALVISINGSAEFMEAYDYLPDLELYEDGAAPDTVPEMVEVVPGSIRAGLGSDGSNVPALSSISDSIVMYRWDGASDLVEDLDYLVWGSDTRYRADKTGVAIDGPDDGDDASSYVADTAAASQISAGAAHTFGLAFQRVDLVEAGETSSGGNGATGHDETGEDLAASWINDAAQDPAGPPAQYFPAAPIVTAGEVGDFYGGVATTVSVTAVAVDIVDGMSVWYSVDGGELAFVDGSDQGEGVWQAEIPAQSAGAVVEWYALVSGSDGGLAIWPAGGDRLPASAVVADVPAPVITSASAAGALAGFPCTVTVRVDAVNLDLTGTLYYAVGGGSFDTVAMTADGTTLTGDIPGQSEGTVVSWYVTVEDGNANSDTHPEDAPTTVEEVTFSAASMGPAKLLITEVNTGPNIHPFEGMHQVAPEFIEIHNPNGFAVNLSDFYITDAINYNYSTQVYWAITDGSPTQSTVGGGHYNDFTARFPAGFIIDAEQTIVISTASSGRFESVYNRLPDIEMYADEMSVEGIPAMRPVFDFSTADQREDSIYTPDRDPGSDDMPRGIPEVEEYYGEPVILYHWTEGAPTVTDVDVLMLGESKTGSFSVGFDKSLVPGYQPDTPIADQDWFDDLDTTGSLSYTRTDADEGTQTATGGNGVDGRDETSENWSETFAKVYPTPGVFFAGLEPANDVVLDVEPRTFLPVMGETFPISMVSLENSETKLRILDLEGRLVITLWDSRFDGEVSGIPDFPTVVEWDGRDDTYQQVRAGMYVVHLQTVNRLTGDKVVKTAPVVVATRLK